MARLTPLQRRQLEGCLCRVPSQFYVQVWDILVRVPQGIRTQGHTLPHQPTLTNMTRSELNFGLLVEDILNHIQQPEYRQIIVEVILNDYKYCVVPILESICSDLIFLILIDNFKILQHQSVCIQKQLISVELSFINFFYFQSIKT